MLNIDELNTTKNNQQCTLFNKSVSNNEFIIYSASAAVLIYPGGSSSQPISGGEGDSAWR